MTAGLNILEGKITETQEEVNIPTLSFPSSPHSHPFFSPLPSFHPLPLPNQHPPFHPLLPPIPSHIFILLLPLLFLNPLPSFRFLLQTSLSFLLTPQIFPTYPFFSLPHCTPSVFSCTLPPLSSDTPTLPYLPLLPLSPLHPFLFIIYTSPDFS